MSEEDMWREVERVARLLKEEAERSGDPVRKKGLLDVLDTLQEDGAGWARWMLSQEGEDALVDRIWGPIPKEESQKPEE